MLRARRFYSVVLFLSLISLTPSFAQTKNTAHPVTRITAAIDQTDRVRLHGQVHPLARPQFDVGPAPFDLPMGRITLLLSGTPEQESNLDQLLLDLHDPSSPQFHHWLTPDDFGKQFGSSDQDIAVITAWLQANGFQVNRIARNRRMIEFSGTAGQVHSAFSTEIHRYLVNGEEHFANAQEPAIPAALSGVVSGFVSLHDFKRQSFLRLASPVSTANSLEPNSVAQPQFNTGSGTHQLTPYDIATIYNIAPLWSQGIDGTGQTIAIVSRSNVGWGDVGAFRNTFHMNSSNISAVFNGNDPGLVPGDVFEAESDAEWASAVAKNASVKLVISASTASADGIDLSSIYAVDNLVAPVLLVSYGSCEAAGGAFYGGLWKQAAAEGISVVVSAGDNGSAGCDDPSAIATHGFAVNALASTPDDVAVGGTALNEGGQDANYWSASNDQNLASALGYIPETTWNESSSVTPISLAAGSGGVSILYDSPAWQTGNGVPSSDPGDPSAHHRYLPDVSFSAAQHDSYFVCLSSVNECSFVASTGIPLHDAVWGTSLSAPVFAGIMALVNQQIGSPQGNPNFHLYPLSQGAGIYHDVISGSNAVPCSGGAGCSGRTMSGYSAGPGYDLATGWGSTDANALVTQWSSVNFTPTTVNGAANPTTFQHGSAISLSASVSASSGTPTGAIAAYVVNNGTTLALGDKVLGGSDFPATNLIPGGSPTLYFRYGGDGVFGSSVSAGVPLTVTPEPSSVNGTGPSASVAPGAFSVNATVTGQSGIGIPSGTVTLSQGSTLTGSGTLDRNGFTSISGTYAPSTPGTYPFTLNYQGDSSFAASSATVNVTFGKSTPIVSLQCPNGDRDIVQGYSLSCTVYVINGTYYLPPISGTVQVLDTPSAQSGSTPMGSPLTLTWDASQREASATINLSTLSLGHHNLTATYSGDSSWNSGETGIGGGFNVVIAPSVEVSFSTAVGGVAPGTQFLVLGGAQPQQYGPGMNGQITVFDGSTAVGSYTIPVMGISQITQYPFNFSFNDPSHPWSLGTHVLTVTYGGDSFWPTTTSAAFNFVISSTPDFSFSNIAPLTVKQGSSVSTTFAMLSITGFTGSVALNCSGAPAGATCSVPSSALLGTTQVLKIVTTTPSGQQSAMLLWPAILALLPVGLVAVSLPRKKKCLLTLSTLALAAALVSCGGGGSSPSSSTLQTTTTPPTPNPGTPTGTYTITITGTGTTGSNTLTHTIQVPLTVQ